jgi:hypothetical protein
MLRTATNSSIVHHVIKPPDKIVFAKEPDQ